MTSEEYRILEEADAQVRDSAIRFAEAQMTSGIRPPPVVEVSETNSDTEPFGLETEPIETTAIEDQSSPPCPPC